MTRKFTLAIPQGCHENWENMEQTDKGRFCASCNKPVIDFINMTDLQLALFIKNHSRDSLCGRLHPDQLNRDIEIPKKRIPWVKYFFQFTLPAFLISMKATAQGNVKLTRQHTITKPRTVFIPARNYFLNESPTDSMNNNKSTQPVMSVNTPAIDFALMTKSAPQISVCAALSGRVGGLVIIEHPKKTKIPKQISLVTQKLMDTAFKFFKIFPNPVSPGASLHIEWKKTEEGYYKLELINVSGKTVHSREVWIDAEPQLLNLEVPSITPGNYFLRATNKESGKNFTEKIVIE